MGGSRELVVRARRVVTPEGLGPRSVHVVGGAVARVAAFDDVPPGAAIEEVGDDLVLMAGLVDTHVHVNEPGRTEWEGFASATRAAAAGGVTTIVDMPLNSVPATTSVRALEAKARAAEGKCWVDVGLTGGVVPGNAGELAPMFRAGALAFKCFLADSGVDEFRHVGEADLEAALPLLASAGAPLLVHAELPGPLAAAAAAIAGDDPRAYATYLASRPARAEDEAVELLIRLADRLRARAHVVHLSSAGALPLLRRARDAGVAITAETCPHYLHFAAERILDGATAFKCAPPIRGEANRALLWDALREGLVDQVVTDHSPSTAPLKCVDSGDFAAAWGGIAGLQLGLAAVWTEARARGRTVVDVARWMGERPAALVGLERRKGTIAAGRDADLVAWAPDAPFVVDVARLEHKNKVTPYHGEELVGRVRTTWLRGERVYDQGAFAGRPRGELLLRGDR